MTHPHPLAEAVRDLPVGLSAFPATPGDVPGITALIRAVDVAGCGHSSSNEAEVHDDLAGRGCGWGRGAAVVRRAAPAGGQPAPDAPHGGDDAGAPVGDLVGALIVRDGLADGNGWDVDVFVAPGDPHEAAVAACLVAAGIEEGAVRWDRAGAPPVAASACFANDAMLREVLEAAGFEEVRRFWRMIRDHRAGEASADPAAPPGCAIRPVAGEADLRTLHTIATTSFAEHFDFHPLAYDAWREQLSAATEDPSQWLLAEVDGIAVGFARGSDRYASEGLGYVASIGVLAAHRRLGIAAALLRTRFTDDARRGRRATLLHVDAANTTGATRVYEAAGMRVDQEYVWFHRALVPGA